jgi:hypothetical protein
MHNAVSAYEAHTVLCLVQFVVSSAAYILASCRGIAGLFTLLCYFTLHAMVHGYPGLDRIKYKQQQARVSSVVCSFCYEHSEWLGHCHC